MRVSCDVRRPIEFWFTMATWDLMLVVFTTVFALGIYGMWRALAPH